MRAGDRTMDGLPAPLEEWRKGWPVVMAAGIGYGTGGAMIMLLGSLFIKPMRDALGWSTTAVTIVPIVTVVWALCNPLAGAAIDRLGSRRVGIFGMLGMALCAVLLAVLPISSLTLYGTAALMGVFASMTSVATYTRGVASWFRRSVGLAFGIALSGSAAVAIVATPLTGMAISEYGWRAGFLALAGIILFIGLPAVALFYRERMAPSVAGQAQAPVAGFTLGEALRDFRFWCYAVAFTLACIAVSGTVAHLQPLLADKGFPLAQALLLGVVYAIAISVGKIVGGMLLDRIWPFVVACGITVVAGAGSFGLGHVASTTAFPLVALMVGAIGIAAGAEADFIGFFGLRSFGIRAFSTIVGILAMIVTLGVAFGGWLYGFLFDIYGNYEIASFVGAACLLASSVIILMAGHGERASPRPLERVQLG